MKPYRKLQYLANCLLYNRRSLNKSMICLRRSFREVYDALNPGCTPDARARRSAP